jgi:hypothetical protein
MKKDVLVPKPEWWKHLRNFAGRLFWKRQRRAGKKELNKHE